MWSSRWLFRYWVFICVVYFVILVDLPNGLTGGLPVGLLRGLTGGLPDVLVIGLLSGIPGGI